MSRVCTCISRTGFRKSLRQQNKQPRSAVLHTIVAQRFGGAESAPASVAQRFAGAESAYKTASREKTNSVPTFSVLTTEIV